MNSPAITTNVSTKEAVVTLLREQEQAARDLGVQRLGLFGSFQRGTQTAESDVDLFVEFKPGAATFDHLMQLSFLCEDLFGRSVEIVTPGSLSPYLGPRIMKEVGYVLQQITHIRQKSARDV